MKIQKYQIFKKKYNNYKNKTKITNIKIYWKHLKINKNQQLHQKNKLQQLKNKKKFQKEKKLNWIMH